MRRDIPHIELPDMPSAELALELWKRGVCVEELELIIGTTDEPMSQEEIQTVIDRMVEAN